MGEFICHCNILEGLIRLATIIRMGQWQINSPTLSNLPLGICHWRHWDVRNTHHIGLRYSGGHGLPLAGSTSLPAHARPFRFRRSSLRSFWCLRGLLLAVVWERLAGSFWELMWGGSGAPLGTFCGSPSKAGLGVVLGAFLGHASVATRKASSPQKKGALRHNTMTRTT